ncbi:transmembrane protein 6/97 [Podospora conica]|nr:transmembrane protein 6/97 [Schizothecium conicum]
MTTYTRSWMNEVWLVWSVLQLPLILLVDNLELYPERFWKPAGSLLHFAYGAKQDYIAEFNDPIPQWSAATASGHDSWMGLFCHLEVLFALPIIIFTIFRLGIQRKGTSGAHELALLVYAFEAAFTTLTCMNDVLYWDATIYPAALKQKLLLNMYAPFFVIPSILFIDMASRMLGRFREADALLAGKKAQ